MSDDQTFDAGHAYGSPCMSCGKNRREVGELGGWCANCSGEEPTFDAEACRAATLRMAAMARESPSWLRQKAEATRLLNEYEQKRTPRRKRFGSAA